MFAGSVNGGLGDGRLKWRENEQITVKGPVLPPPAKLPWGVCLSLSLRVGSLDLALLSALNVLVPRGCLRAEEANTTHRFS